MKNIIFFLFTSFLINVISLPTMSIAAGTTPLSQANTHKVTFQHTSLASLPWQIPQRLIVNDVCWDCL